MTHAALLAVVADLAEQQSRLARVLVELVSSASAPVTMPSPVPTSGSAEEKKNELVTVAEFCKRARVSRSTVYKWIGEPSFPSVARGRVRRIVFAEAMAWIANGRGAETRTVAAVVHGERVAVRAAGGGR